MTCLEFDQLRARAGDRCEICRAAAEETIRGMLFIDHDHRLGKWAVRGLLCNSCNTWIGYPFALAAERVTKYLANPWRLTPPGLIEAQEIEP